MKMKRILSAVVICAMALSLAACGNTNGSNNGHGGSSAGVTVANPVTSFSGSYGKNPEDVIYLNVSPAQNEGKVMIDYVVGDKQTRGTVDASLMHALASVYEKSDLAALNEKSSYEEGEAIGTLYMDFADGSIFTCDFGGKIPDEFVSGFEALQKEIESAMENMEPYRAQVHFDDDVNAEAKAELNALFAHLSNQALENNAVSNVAADDANYAYNTGLENADGIANTTVAMNMMGTVPHSIALFQLADGTDSAAIQQSLMTNADWRKWVCVSPNVALTATKGNNVLFAMTLTEISEELVPALQAEGWTVTATAENPDLVDDGAL